MFQKFLRKDRFPLLILLECTVAYGLFIPYLGFYWDDFPYVWFKHSSGITGVIKALALDRPMLGAFYAIPMTLLGETPWIWQVFAIFSRWIFTLAAYGLIKSIFPDHKEESKLIIILFSVFPGFTQQWISVIYSHAFLIFALYLFSFSLFVKHIRSEKRNWLTFILSIILPIISLMASEYMAGLEVLRPLIIFKVITEKNTNKSFIKRIRQTFIQYIPYLFADLLFIYYRVFIASSVLYKVQKMNDLSSSPALTIIDMFRIQFVNIYRSTVISWGQIFTPLKLVKFSSLFGIVYLAVTGAIFFISFMLLRKVAHHPVSSESKNVRWKTELCAGAFISLFFVGIPFWTANLSPDVHFPNDRIFIPFMLGSSILIYLLIGLARKNRLFFSLIFSIVLSLSISWQVYQSNNYRVEWDYLKQFFEQISWRVPSLKENTLLVTDELPLRYYSDNSLTAAFNWLYSQKEDCCELPYLINYTKARLGKSLPSLDPGVAKITHNYRTYTFEGSTDQLILFYHSPPGCVHFADPDLDLHNPLLPKDIRPYANLSKLELISDNEQKNQVFFYQDSKQGSWCYYYQKANLAIQENNWGEAANLGDTAFLLEDHPNDASERLPFIEAYAMVNRFDDALQLTNDTLSVSNLYQPMLCRLWERILDNNKSVLQNSSSKSRLEKLLDCN